MDSLADYITAKVIALGVLGFLLFIIWLAWSDREIQALPAKREDFENLEDD